MKRLHSSISRTLARAVNKDEPGIAIGVTRGGSVLLTASRGLASLATREPMTSSTPFRICSITKQFICALIWREVEAGRIAVDAHPSRYVSWMRCFDPTLTIRHLMQNQSGIRDQWVLAMIMGAKAEQRFTLEDGVDVMKRAPDSMFPPGYQSLYCNGNFELLGLVLQAVTGEDFATALRAHILLPLKMSDTFVGVDTAQPLPGGARGYRYLKGRWVQEVNGLHWSASAGIVTTIDDLLKWDRCLRDPIALGLPWVERIKAAEPFSDGNAAAYASGINHWVVKDRALLTHQGALRGWRSALLRFVKEDIGICVFMNRTQSPSGVFPALAANRVAKALGVAPVWSNSKTKTRSRARITKPGWYCSPEHGLLVQLRNQAGKGVAALQRNASSLFQSQTPGVVESEDQHLHIALVSQEHIRLSMAEANVTAVLHRLETGKGKRFLANGSYRCEQIETTMHILHHGARLSVQFEGPFGTGAAYDVTVLNALTAYFDIDRGVDETPPGRAMMVVDRHQQTVEISFALARRIVFRRVKDPSQS